MKYSLAIAISMLLSSPVVAQMMGPPPGAFGGFASDRTFQAIVESHNDRFERRDTEAEREARLQKAIAVRAEASELLIADGGVMTRQHQAYIRRKADRILTD